MKHIHIIVIALALLLSSCDNKQTSPSERINIDFNWQFHLGNMEMKDLNNNNSRTLDLPHDWSIEGIPEIRNASGKDGGYYPGGIAWYQKEIPWSKSWDDKQVTITFDGVYMNSDVWLNGHHLGNKPNGYIGFTYDMTPYLTSGNNTITVKVDNSKQPSARWYTGCGIYRHVWIDVKNKVHLPLLGTHLTFSHIDSTYAKMNTATEIKNTSSKSKEITLVTKLIQANEAIVGQVSNTFVLEANSSFIAEQSLDIISPQLWSPTNPYLYQLETTILDANTVLDIASTRAGIRSIKIDSQTGFWLNGQNIKIKGVCMHHDAGSLGSAVPEDVWIRRIQLLKEMGCNAIRTSHNPFRPEFFDMCDSMGILVMDEALDGWDKPKAKYDYGIYFNEWWKTDLTYFIKRDRNHPSVIMWSIGNEVSGRTDSVETLLYTTIKELDSTRFVTIGAGHNAKIVDIAGFNGSGEVPNSLERFHKKYPNSPVIGTEVPHSWQTRGVYRTKTWWRGRDFPAPWSPHTLGKEPKEGKYFPIADLTDEELFTDVDSSYLSSYGNATVRISARDQWKRTLKYDWLMGEFRWTGFDYLGENIWPNRGWHCGVLDLAGFKKDLYYFYQSVWSEKPMVHILPHWTHPGKEGIKIPVVVYSNCEEVELFLNGKSLGSKKDTQNDLRLMWYVPYEEGELKAVARTSNGESVSTAHSTAKVPYALQLSSDKVEITANKRSVAHVTVKIVDKQGNFVPEANIPFTYEIKGPGKLLGIENGDMLDLTSNKAKTKKTFNGLSLIYIQSANVAGKVEITVKAEGLVDGTIEVLTLPNTMTAE